jgi:hypothetical protein
VDENVARSQAKAMTDAEIEKGMDDAPEVVEIEQVGRSQ